MLAWLIAMPSNNDGGATVTMVVVPMAEVAVTGGVESAIGACVLGG